MIDITKEYPAIAAEVVIYRSVRLAFEMLKAEGRENCHRDALRISQARLQRLLTETIEALTTAESIGYDLDDDSPIVVRALEEHRTMLRAQLP